MQSFGRVIAGKYRHKRLIVLSDEQTRTTKDRVKEAIFSALGDSYYDKLVLDLFAGSGALGIEALSRGAKSAIFCENDKNTQSVLKQNLQIVGEPCLLYFEDYHAALSKIAKESVALVFLDPPYDYDIAQVIEEVFAANILSKEYTLVLETDHAFPGEVNNAKIKRYKYGLTHVTIIRGEL